MKLFIVLAAVALAQAGKLDRTYLPPNAQGSAGSAFLQTPRQSNEFNAQTGAYSSNGLSSQSGYNQNGAYSGFEARPERAQASFERNAAILRQDNSNDGDSYAYSYETENGIYGEEIGVATNGVQAQGGYSYTGDDGKVYSVKYTADENGFQPQGDHLPTPPPIPEEILKALEQNARDEAAGIFDDGYYREAQQQNSNNIRAGVVTGVQKAYLPPVAQGNNQAVVRQSTFNNNAFTRNDASGSGNLVAGIQKAYLPPFAQGNNQGVTSRPTLNTNAFVRNDASGSLSAVAGVQKAYLPPFAQGNNQGLAKRPAFNNNAFARNDASGSGSSVAGVQKAYLPPVAQRRQSSFNARDGYRY